MKAVRRDSLRLIQIYINKETNFYFFRLQMLPTLQELVNDYKNAYLDARDPEVLGLFSILFKKMGEQLQDFLK
jgi:CRM1 C terminal